MTRIREAQDGDVPRLVEMGMRFIAESEYASMIEPNREQLAHTVAWLRSTGALFVAECDDALVGMVGMMPTFAHPVSGERVASEFCWWVEPEARVGRTGLRLLARAEQWARESGAVHFQMVAPNATVAGIYERLRFQRVETAYSKRVA